MRTIKTLHVFHHADLLNGVDRTTLTLVKALSSLGHKPRAIVQKEGDVTEALRNLQIPFDISPLGCCTGQGPHADQRYLERILARASLVEQVIRRHDIEAVHLNTGHVIDAAMAASACGTPAYWHIHSPILIDFSRFSKLMAFDTYISLLKSTGTQIIAVSDDVAASIPPDPDPDQNSCVTLHNGIDIDSLSRSPEQKTPDVRAEFGFEAGCPLVIGVGRICEQKDFGSFIEVAAHIFRSDGSVRFIICGPVENRELEIKLKSRASELGLERALRFIGPRRDVASLLNQSNLFLSTSLYEGHPLAVIEAMLGRVPVVAFDCDGLRECIQHDVTGVLVPDRNVEQCAVRVLRVLDDPDFAMTLATRAQAKAAQKFSSQVYAEGFIKILLEDSIPAGLARKQMAHAAVLKGYFLSLLDNIIKSLPVPEKGRLRRIRRHVARIIAGITQN